MTCPPFSIKGIQQSAEYEDMLVGLKLAHYVKAPKVVTLRDSRFAVNQINSAYEA